MVAAKANNLKGAIVRFGSEADTCSARAHVRFTPESRHLQCTRRCLLWAHSGHRLSLDHLVGASEEGNGYLYPDCFSGFEIYHQLKFCRLLDWQIRWTGTLEDTIHVACGTLKQIHFVWPIRNEPTIGSKITEVVDRWQTVLCG